jgi:hypothetical protein
VKPIPDAHNLDLAQIRVVDAHCHPVGPLEEPLTVSRFERLISLTFMEHNQTSRARRRLVSNWPVDSFPRTTMMLNYLYRQLADFLGAPLDPVRIIEVRNQRAKDYAGYTRDLMSDAGIEQLVVDSGFPGPRRDFEDFCQVVQIPVWEIVRTDHVMYEVSKDVDDFGRFIAAYSARLDENLHKSSCVGLKSEIAYLTGLNIGPLDIAEASKLYPAFRENPAARGFKALRDYCFHIGLQLCIERNKPMQIHCGFGSDDIRFSLAAPHNLYELLAFPPYSDCLVVLVHGGYPWAKEAAYMTNVLPNVFLDFSETCPLTAYGAGDTLWEIFQVAPINKVMYGSDAFLLPELFWLGTKLGRNAVNQVLSRLVDIGFLGKADVLTIARFILRDNAVELYQLS